MTAPDIAALAVALAAVVALVAAVVKARRAWEFDQSGAKEVATREYEQVETLGFLAVLLIVLAAFLWVMPL